MKIQTAVTSSLVVLFLAPAAYSKSFKGACPDIRECVKAVSALTHDQYIFADSEIRTQKTDATENLELTPENANLLFTTYLNMSQLSRVPVNANTYKIVRVNDAKGMSVPHFNANATEDGNLPDTADMVNLTYTATHPESVKNMENIIRTFSNMGARIYGDEASGTLMITSSSNEIKQLLPMFRKLDVKVEKREERGPHEGSHSHARPSVIRDPKNTATPDPK